MSSQITRRERKEERQGDSMARYFSAFFEALLKRVLRALILAVIPMGIICWEKGAAAKAVQEEQSSDDKSFDLDFGVEELSMLMEEAVSAKGKEGENLRLEKKVLDDRVSLLFSDETETVAIHIFSAEAEQKQEDPHPAEQSKWDEFEALWKQCDAILKEEGSDQFERFSWHMTDAFNREEETLGKFILYGTEEGKQGFFRQYEGALYQVERQNVPEEDVPEGDVPEKDMPEKDVPAEDVQKEEVLPGKEQEEGGRGDIQERKEQIERLSATKKYKEEQEKWEKPKSGLYEIMLWNLWKGRMPARGVGFDSSEVRNAAYGSYLSTEIKMPSWEEIMEKEELWVFAGGQVETLSDLKKFPHLKWLHFSGANHGHINFDLTGDMVPELEELHLLEIDLENLYFLEKFPQLKSLTAAYCGLQDISGLEYQKELQRINLQDNQITDLPFLRNRGNLIALYISDNLISDIAPLEELTGLETLYLEGNEIQDIDPLEGLRELRNLNLSNNKIQDITPLEGLRELRTLDLSNNEIQDIDSLEGLAKLRNLDLGYNKIQNIRVVENLQMLCHLNLYHNQIKDFSPALEPASLTYISVGENPGQNQIGDLVFLPDCCLTAVFPRMK
ncbi:MAG: leucine-rich repeat domain-containing protein [Lachnospiraceae bacterium]|nr:leucine-rich repeat domain-containing protein [Lachnospiraceae bacterium]